MEATFDVLLGDRYQPKVPNIKAIQKAIAERLKRSNPLKINSSKIGPSTTMYEKIAQSLWLRSMCSACVIFNPMKINGPKKGRMTN